MVPVIIEVTLCSEDITHSISIVQMVHHHTITYNLMANLTLFELKQPFLILNSSSENAIQPYGFTLNEYTIAF